MVRSGHGGRTVDSGANSVDGRCVHASGARRRMDARDEDRPLHKKPGSGRKALAKQARISWRP